MVCRGLEPGQARETFLDMTIGELLEHSPQDELYRACIRDEARNADEARLREYTHRTTVGARYLDDRNQSHYSSTSTKRSYSG